VLEKTKREKVAFLPFSGPLYISIKTLVMNDDQMLMALAFFKNHIVVL
jgi:hypothetical protein